MTITTGAFPMMMKGKKTKKGSCKMNPSKAKKRCKTKKKTMKKGYKKRGK